MLLDFSLHSQKSPIDNLGSDSIKMLLFSNFNYKTFQKICFLPQGATNDLYHTSLRDDVFAKKINVVVSCATKIS